MAVVRIIFEGGRSDDEDVELDIEKPPPYLERSGQKYGRVVDHHDQPMRDIFGRWRYRLSVPYVAPRPGHSAIDVKP